MRKHFIYIGILFLLGFNAIAAEYNTNQVFNSANQLYAQKKYKESIVLYKQIEKSKIFSSNLYENMASAELHLGHIAKALLYLEKAKKYASNTESINDKIQTILSSQHLEYEQTSASMSEFFAKKLTEQNWSLLAIILSTLVSIFIIIYFSTKQILPIKTFLLIIGVSYLGVVFFYYMAAINRKIIETNNWSIIIEDKTELKNTPDQSATTNYEVQTGSKFEIKDKIGNWYLLQNQFGKKGWADIKNIEII